MYRVLLDWRGVKIHSYPAMLYLGLVFGMAVGLSMASAAGLDPNRVLIAMLLLIIAGLIGARGLVVLVHWEFFRREPQRIWRQSDGGAAMLGGLLAKAALSVPLLAALEIPLAPFWDAMTFAILIGLIFGRIGCLLNGCCRGRPSDRWFALYLPDRHGVWQWRIPTQLLEAGVAALLLVGAVILWNRQPFPGAVILAAVGLYGLARLGLQATREVHERIGTTNVQQVLAGGLAFLALAGLLLGWIASLGDV